MIIDVDPFRPARATIAELADYYRLVLAACAVDWPQDPVHTYESVIGGLHTSLIGRSESRFWIARCAGQLAGILKFAAPEAENGHLAIVEVRVHPECRRAGVGTALLRAAVPTILAQGRRIVAGSAVEASTGFHWAERLHFKVVVRNVLQRLDLTAADPGLWQVDPPKGYVLSAWAGEAPTRLLDSYVRARGAIHGRPRQDSSYLAPAWTPTLIREVEQDLRRRGVEQRVVVAIHEATNAVVGLTVLELFPHRPSVGFQKDTAVMPEHRGLGLGRCVKAAMLRELVVGHPETRQVDTITAAENTYMIRINHSIGYTTFRAVVDVELGVRELARELGILGAL